MNIVKQKEGGKGQWGKNQMRFPMNFSKESGYLYRKAFGEEVAHLTITSHVPREDRVTVRNIG